MATRVKKLKGVVLVMVVMVMVVLIMLLLATLTVVSTAQNRYYTKFEENQAYYAARSALDLFKTNLLNDDTYYAYTDSTMTTPKTYYYTAYGATPDYTKTEKMTQGRALELDIYDITAQNDAGIASNIVANDNVFGGNTSNYDNQNYAIAEATRPVTIDATKPAFYTDYEIVLPDVDDGSTKYGLFCDDGKAKIKVEVLKRRYDSGGKLDVFTDAELKSYSATGVIPTTDPKNTTGAEIDIKDAIKGGTRSKDEVFLRITASTTFLGTDGTAVLEYDTKEGKKSKADNALTTTGSFAGASGAIVSAAGGVSTLNEGVSTMSDGNGISGNVFTVGGLKWQSAAQYYMDEGCGICVYKDFDFVNAPSIKTAGKNFIYVGGKATVKNQVAANGSPLTFVANEIQPFLNDINIGGDVVVNQLDTFDPLGNIAQNYNIGGTLYFNKLSTKIMLDTSNSYIYIVVPNNFKGVCAGGLTRAGGIPTSALVPFGDVTEKADGSVISDFATNTDYNLYTPYYCDASGNILTATVTGGTGAFDITSYTTETEDNKISRVYTVPSSAGTIKVPTAQFMFSEYFKENAFDPSTGDLTIAAGMPAGTTSYAPVNVNSLVLSAGDELNKKDAAKFPDNKLDIYTKAGGPVLSGSLINASGILNPGNNNITFDTSGGDLYIELKSGTYGGIWDVIGTNYVNFLMPAGTSSSTKNYTFDNCKIQTEDIKSTTTNIVNGETTAPKVYFYADTYTNIGTSNNCFFAGYFYMPTASFIKLKNGCSTTVAYKADSSASAVNIGNSAIVGSVICNHFECENKPGLIYLEGDSGGAKPGSTIFDWDAYQYRNNVK